MIAEKVYQSPDETWGESYSFRVSLKAAREQ